MPPQQHQEQRPNVVKSFLVAIAKCLLGILVLPFYCVFGILYGLVFAIFFAGPLAYYRSTVLNSNALLEKYATEGIRNQGRVIKRWKTGEGSEHGPTYHVRVTYRLDEYRYTKDLIVTQSTFSETTVELIRLSQYPKSAILYSTVQGVDPDFPPSKVAILFFAFFWMTMWNLIPLILILTSIGSCSYCTSLIGPVFVGLIVLELTVGYWVAKRARDTDLRSLLYGAIRVGGTQEDTNVPERISYQEFFHEDKHSCFSVSQSIVKDLCLVLAWILAFVYFVVLGGGYMMMYSLVIARWRNQLLERYNDSSKTSSVLGAVVCQKCPGQVIVRYTVDSQTFFKKRMSLPHKMVRRGCANSMQYETISDEDSPELLYFTNEPESAVLKLFIDHRQEEQKRLGKQKWAGLYAMAIQITIPTLIFGMYIQDNQESNDTMIFLPLAGICLACHIVLGFAGGCFQYHYIFKKSLLDGAKRVNSPRETDNDSTAMMDEEEQELDSLQDDDAMKEAESEDAHDSAAEETADNFVNDFMKGKFPRLDKAFG